jgi:hypothetical protein
MAMMLRPNCSARAQFLVAIALPTFKSLSLLQKFRQVPTLSFKSLRRWTRFCWKARG